MNITADERLADYICDYIDGTMDPVVEDVFEEYMGQNSTVQNFVQSSLMSKRILNQLPVYTTTYNFETELYHRIELEKQLNQLEVTQNRNYKNGSLGLFELSEVYDENKSAFWMSFMCMLLMILAAGGYWLW